MIQATPAENVRYPDRGNVVRIGIECPASGTCCRGNTKAVQANLSSAFVGSFGKDSFLSGRREIWYGGFGGLRGSINKTL